MEKVRNYILKDCKVCKGEMPSTEEKKIDNMFCKICKHCGECVSYEHDVNNLVNKKRPVSEKKKKKKQAKKEVEQVFDPSVIQLEENHIYHNDTFIQTTGIKDETFDFILEDTPYGYDYQSNHREEKFEKIQDDDNLNWLPKHLRECYRILKNDCYALFFCQDTVIEIFKKEIQEAGFVVKNTLIWDKTNGGAGDLEGQQMKDTEFMLLCAKGKVKLKTKRKGTLYRYPRDYSVDYQHPTQKPINLMRALIQDYCPINGLLFDGFTGRGTVPMAAVMEKVNYIAIEKFEEYYLTAVDNVLKIENGIEPTSKNLKRKIKKEGISKQLKMF